VLGKVAGANFRIGRVTVKQLSLEGPLKLPALDVDALISGDGSLQSLKLTGGDKLVAQLSPKGSDIGFEITAASLALPFVPALTLSDFTMKGTANRGGVTSSEFDGRSFDGVISGTARIRWGSTWAADGEVRARAVKIAVFAPALVSEGKVEGRAAYTMSAAQPGSLYEGARMQGEFKIEQGVLGSFDLTRALQTGGQQTTGRTVFSELTGQGVYDKGVVQLRNLSVTAGAMNAGMSLDIDANGGLAGRIAAEVKTPNQTLRSTLNISGKVADPVIRK
jgi:cytoskeletal protein CcmA (bactofilin family)